MYVIVVYDVNVERVNRVHKLLKTYLFGDRTACLRES